MMLDKGEAVFYRSRTSGGDGDMPDIAGAEAFRCWYGERTVGTTRYYAARQAMESVDMLIRILRPAELPGAGWSCVIGGSVYRVTQVQALRDEDAGEDVLDISLERIGDNYTR